MTKYLNAVADLSLDSVRSLDRLISLSRAKIDEARRNLEFAVDMAQRLGQIGKADAARSYVEQADAARRTIAEALYFIGECRTFFGDVAGSNALYRQALQLDPPNVDAAVALGRGLHELGSYADAIAVLEDVLSRAAGDPRIHLYLGETLRELRRVDEADEHFRAAITSSPAFSSLRTDAPLDRAAIWEDVAKKAIGGLHDTYRWRRAVAGRDTIERDLARLKRLANGRPIYLTAIEGRGWVLSHMVSQIEPFLRQLWLDGVRDPFVVVLNPNRFCNPPLVKMYERSVCMIDDRYPRLRARLMALRETLRAQGSPIAADIDRFNPRPQVFNQYVNHLKGWLEAPRILRFTPEEEARGRAIARRIGIADGQQHVCWGVREMSYYTEAWTPRNAYRHPWEANLETGSRRETIQPAPTEGAAKPDHAIQRLPTLHTPVSNYLPMAGMLAQKGLYALRMGLNVDNPLPEGLHPNVIDYASKYREDFADIYMFATSKFVVAGGTGIIWINAAFGKPFVMTDLYLPNNITFNSCPDGMPNLMLPRLYWNKREERYLTFSESFKVCRYYQIEANCLRDGIDNIPNTPDELIAVVEEMNARIDGTWVDQPGDEERQRRFHALLQPHDEGYGLNGRVGAAFLRAHEDLIR